MTRTRYTMKNIIFNEETIYCCLFGIMNSVITLLLVKLEMIGLFKKVRMTYEEIFFFLQGHSCTVMSSSGSHILKLDGGVRPLYCARGSCVRTVASPWVASPWVAYAIDTPPNYTFVAFSPFLFPIFF